MKQTGRPQKPLASTYRNLLFHKPFNVLCQFTAGHHDQSGGRTRRTLADFIAVPDVYPVGRLDYDSEGLLLLTNDGVLQHRLSDPSFAHPRTYWAQVEGLITEEAIEQLRRGVSVQDYRTRPAKAHTIADPPLPPREPSVRFRAHIPTSWLELTLTEGRNRQVRRMTAAIGFPTLRLIRVALGPLWLEALSPGSWRDITEAEHQALRSAFQKKGAMDAKKGGRESRPERQFKRVR